MTQTNLRRLATGTGPIWKYIGNNVQPTFYLEVLNGTQTSSVKIV